MRKTGGGGETTSSDSSPIQNDSGNSEEEGSALNNSSVSVNFPLLEARIKHGRDEDTPINLVKDRGSNSSGDAAKDIDTCHENLIFSNELNKQHIISPTTSKGNSDAAVSTLDNGQSLDTTVLRKRLSVYDGKGSMSDSIESVGKLPKCSNVTDGIPGLVPNQVVTAAVGGMLAKQLVSPLKSSYNNNLYSERNNIHDESFSPTGLHSSSRTLPPLTLASSSSSLPPPSYSSVSETVHSNLVFYSRSHNRVQDSSLEFGSNSSSDLDTNSTMVVSKLVKDVNAGLEPNSQSPSTSNYVVISDPESRLMESAGKLPF